MSQPVSHLRAIGYALAGFTLWAASDALLKLTSETTVPKYEIMALSVMTGLVVIWLIMWLQKKTHKLRPHRYRGLIGLGLVYSLNVICILFALQHLPLANFYAIVFLAPLLIAVLAALFLREHLDWKKALAIAAGFGGVLVAVNPAYLSDDGGDLVSHIAVFIAVILFAIQMLMLRFLGRHETSEAMAFCPRIIGLLGALGAGLILGFEPVPATALIYVLSSGCIGAVGWLCMTAAYKHAPAATVSPFHYSQIVTGSLLGYLIWHDVPSWNVMAGVVIVIASGLYIAHHTHRAQKLAAARI